MIFDAECGNPGDFDNGLVTTGVGSHGGSQGDDEPADCRQQRNHARGTCVAFRHQHQPRCAKEGNVDRPGKHGQSAGGDGRRCSPPEPCLCVFIRVQNVRSFTICTTVLLITPSTSCG